MAVAYRSAANGTYGAKTNTTVTAPAGIQDGDVLIFFLFIAISGTPPTPTAPAGFTAITGFPSIQFGLSGFNGRIYGWSKVAASESGNYTATHSNASSQGLMLAASVTAGQTPAVQATTNTGTGTTTTALGITTVADGDLVVFIGTDWGTTTNNLTAPSGSTPTFTERVDVAPLIYMATGNLATAGATGNKTQTNNSSGTDPWSGSLIGITAAAVNIIQLRPNADVAAGNWTSTGANLHSVLDEAAADDGDKITSGATPTDDVAEVHLQDPATIEVGDAIIKVRVRKV